MTQITQADRDRAADVAALIYGQRVADMIRKGELDGHHLVQAFAAHRIQAEHQTQWQDISTAPKNRPILVEYDHDADPYQDPENPGKLTAYACHAEGGDFYTGKGVAIARWAEGYHQSEGWEYGIEYWMPAVWVAWINNDFSDYVVNAVRWMEIPPPSKYKERQHDAG